ncbi:hypothetical protein DRQ09_03310 [candidate division KSB1 bacterium]|nr:MAG: hypothetical protein DRQ09_03310 [candidate division KSB1 bacterium]
MKHKIKNFCQMIYFSIIFILTFIFAVYSSSNAQKITHGRNNNHPPRITSSPVKKAYQDSLYIYQVTAEDSDGDSLIFSLRIAPEGMTIDSLTGLIKWKPPANIHKLQWVVIQVTDGIDSDVQTFIIIVWKKSDKNSTYCISHTPRIISLPVRHAYQGYLYTYQVIAKDPDGDTITFSLRLAPSGMKIDSTTGLITWIPSEEIYGTKKVIIVVSDGNYECIQYFHIFVHKIRTTPPSTENENLIITSLPEHIAVKDSLYTYQVTAVSKDTSATLKFYLIRGPEEMDIDSLTGIITWIPSSKDSGAKKIKIMVSDGSNIAYQSFKIVVFQSIPPGFLQAIANDTCTVFFNFMNKGKAAIKFRKNGRMIGNNLRLRFYGNTAPGEITTDDTLNRAPIYLKIEPEITDIPGEGFEADISIEYTTEQLEECGVTNAENLTFAYFNEEDSTWVPKKTEINTKNNTASTTTNHFSIWVLADKSNFETSEINSINHIPDNFLLQQNYPNPFNPETKISYQIPFTTKVTIKVYNLLGQEIITLVNKKQVKGKYQVKWNGRDRTGNMVSSGVYIYQIKAGNFIQAKKMMFIK